MAVQFGPFLAEFAPLYHEILLYLEEEEYFSVQHFAVLHQEWEDGVIHGVHPVRVADFVTVTVPRYSVREFREHFRMYRETFEVITRTFSDRPSDKFVLFC